MPKPWQINYRYEVYDHNKSVKIPRKINQYWVYFCGSISIRCLESWKIDGTIILANGAHFHWFRKRKINFTCEKLLLCVAAKYLQIFGFKRNSLRFRSFKSIRIKYLVVIVREKLSKPSNSMDTGCRCNRQWTWLLAYIWCLYIRHRT